MTARKIHMGFDVQGVIRLLEDIPYSQRDLKWKELRDDLERLKKQGVKVASTCPTPVEKEPDVWTCPGHPVKQ